MKVHAVGAISTSGAPIGGAPGDRRLVGVCGEDVTGIYVLERTQIPSKVLCDVCQRMLVDHPTAALQAPEGRRGPHRANAPETFVGSEPSLLAITG